MPTTRDRSAFRCGLAWLVFCASFLVSCGSEPVGTDETQLSVGCNYDGVCDPWVEDCGVCPHDCRCPGGEFCYDRACVPPCGDGVCAPWVEGCDNCPGDCPCPGGTHCGGGVCRPDDPCADDPDPYCCRHPWKPQCGGGQQPPIETPQE